MTTTVKVILAAMGLITATAVVTVYDSHEHGVVAELKREDHERLVERQHAASKEQADDAALRAYLTQPSIIAK